MSFFKTGGIFLTISIFFFSIIFAQSYAKKMPIVKASPKVLKPTIPIATPTSVFETPTPTSIPTPTITKQIAKPLPVPQTQSQDSRADELFEAMNFYRQTRGLPTLAKDLLLCSIAQNRASENQARGSLSHHGFKNYVNSQAQFLTMSEVLFWANFEASGSYIVNEGWDKSPSHNEAINNPLWRNGCGGIAGNYASFEFGA